VLLQFATSLEEHVRLDAELICSERARIRVYELGRRRRASVLHAEVENIGGRVWRHAGFFEETRRGLSRDVMSGQCKGRHVGAARNRCLSGRIAGRIFGEGRVLRPGEPVGEVLPVEENLRLGPVHLRLLRREHCGQHGDEDRGTDYVPLPPP
jgi:hypothetical protein